MKKIPAPGQYTTSLKPKSSFIWSAANPTLARYTNATMYRTNMHGMRCRVTFPNVARSTTLAALSTRTAFLSLRNTDKQRRVSHWSPRI
jgi:hypothetical protein